MHSKYLIIGVLMLVCFKLNAQKPNQPQFNYTQSWKEVEAFTDKGLPKSALEIIERIYAAAKAENNAVQIVKSIIFQLNISQFSEEEYANKNMELLEREIKTAVYPVKPLLHSMLAEVFWRYYQNNRYRFRERTETVNYQNKDITTWSLENIVDATIRNYQLSLYDADKSKSTPISQFQEILTESNKLGKEYRPTLYDFLAHRAVDFFTNNEPDLVNPAYVFTLNSKEYYLGAPEFAEINIVTRDTFAYKYYALKIFQDLIRFHQKDRSPDALIDVDLKRLDFVHLYSTLSNKQELYLAALGNLEAKYKAFPASTLVSFRMAQLWNEKAQMYDPSQSDEHKGDRRKAFELCEAAIKRFPASNGALLASNLQQEIKSKEIGAFVERVNLPNLPFRALVKYRNFSNLNWRIVRVTHDEIIRELEKWEKNYNVDQDQKLLQYLAAKPAVKSGKLVLPADSDFNAHHVEIKLDEVAVGSYAVLFSNNEGFATKGNGLTYAFTTVSNLSYFHRNRQDGSSDLYVINRTTGEAAAGANVQVYLSSYNEKKRKNELSSGDKYVSDTEGYVKIPFDFKKELNSRRPFELEFSNGNDTISTIDINGNRGGYYGQFFQNRREESLWNEQTHFFLDRAIYRPGQPLYYKGLLINTNGKDPKIIAKRKLTISFFDVNAQLVAQQQVETNEYGTFSGTFTTPSSGLMGQMSLASSDNNSSRVYFAVEEYKRPKFEVKFEPVKGSYKFGEKVTVNGKALAYSGANIDGAAVQYRVVRRAIFPFWFYTWRGYYPQSPDMEITNGKSTTDTNGSFVIDFTAIPDETVEKVSSPTFIYQVYADVTDVNGETHSSSTSVNIGYKALMLGVDVKDIDKSNKDSVSRSLGIKTTNLEGEFEPATGNIVIWKLKSPEIAYRERFWQKPDKFLYTKDEFQKLFPGDLYQEENNFYKWDKEKEVITRPFDTSREKALKLDNLNKWDAGKYMLQITAKDKFGEDVKEVAYFDVTDNASDKPSIPSMFDVKNIKVSGEPGEKAQILAGSTGNVRYLYEIERDGEILDKQWGKLDNQQKVFEIPIKEEYRGNIAVHLVTVKNNRMYSSSQLITVPYTNKELDIKFETFRDKLLPGQAEQWKIKIASKNADKTMAEMVATLYDASLDAFAPHQWYAQFYNALYGSLSWQSLNGFRAVQFQDYSNNWNNYKLKKVVNPEFSQLNWFSLHEEVIEREGPAFMVVNESAVYGNGNIKRGARLKKSESFAPSLAEEMKEVTLDADVSGAAKVNPDVKEQDFSDVKVRKNFNETAFFYPHLQTNDQGEVIINFTIPEALTRWKMLGFAHTTDLKSGLIQKELVTQKDLMVVPNQPRFFREHDKMIFQAKVNSMVDKEMEGQARLEFFDALTMQPVDALLKNTDNLRTFALKGLQSTNLEWSIEIPEGLQAISYRIVAKSGSFSDGEEMILPVVTNRTLVTETLPLPIRGKQTKEYTFDKLVNNTSSTLKHQRYTLEFTSNPAWYAVQALPYLMEYPHECTEQIFARFYANSIASHIASTNPLIKRVFDTWSQLQPDALLSNLEKNPELKTALLQETPWVLNAKSESQRKRNIALLFDLNKMAGEQENAINKLTETQLESGSFPWFKGLPEDLFITQYIVSGIGHLEAMGVSNVSGKDKVAAMLTRAIAYMDSRMLDRYNFIKAEAKKGTVKLDDEHIGYREAQYLYARSYFKNLGDANKEAFNYWLNQSKKYWVKQNIYAQGMLALALKRYGETEVPAAIVKSLKERSLNSEEMGMYWKLDRGFYWYEAPVETQALMIEVFDEVANDNKAVDDLKVWLLKQKQTQDWRTTKATAGACYALLRRGTDILSANKLAEITVGKEKIDPLKREDTKVEAGTGYFKTAWTASEITPDMGNIKVKKTDEGVAWGAVYWQYFEQLDKITSAETPLKISKKLFKEQRTDRGPVITPISETSDLHTGDLIKVRIEIRADRTMEYIHLKDMRASAFEPVETLSGFKFQDGLWYYQSPGDLATNFFIGYLPKGTYVFEYSLRVSQVGDFSNGITTIQCMYAPEFSSHSEGVRVKVVK